MIPVRSRGFSLGAKAVTRLWTTTCAFGSDVVHVQSTRGHVDRRAFVRFRMRRGRGERSHQPALRRLLLITSNRYQSVINRVIKVIAITTMIIEHVPSIILFPSNRASVQKACNTLQLHSVSTDDMCSVRRMSTIFRIIRIGICDTYTQSYKKLYCRF